MTKTRILLADDHALLLGAFQRLLEPEYEVVGTVTDGRALLSAAADLKPDVVIVDVAMPHMSGLAAAAQIKQEHPKTKLVFVTMNHDSEVAVEAFRIGASAYLVKTSAASELLHAIREVLRGGTYVTPSITKGMVGSILRQPQRKKPAAELTARQREVVQLLAEGRSMKEVALILDLTPRTVAFHKYRTMEHLHIKSFAELVQFAVQHRIIPPTRDPRSGRRAS
jgi:DNA-binding NarL/FixJ family response regulator